MVIGGTKEIIYKIPLHSEGSGVREICIIVPSEVLSAASNSATGPSHILISDFKWSVEPLVLYPTASRESELS